VPIVAALLLFLLLRRVGISELTDTIRGADLFLVVLSLCVSLVLNLISVAKWQLLVKCQGVSVSLLRLYALHLVGRFFNYFFPTNVGGDVIRGYELGNYTKDRAGAMASVFVERFTGFVTLVGLAAIALVTKVTLIQNLNVSLAVASAIVGLALLLWLVLDARPLTFIMSRIPFPLPEGYVRKFQRFYAGLQAYRNQRRAIALAILWSMLFNFVAILNVYVSAMAFERPLPFLEIAVIVPILLVIGMLPITFNGVGVLEWGYVLMFSWLGLPATIGLSTVVLIRAKDILHAAVGGLLYSMLKLQGRSANISLPGEAAAPNRVLQALPDEAPTASRTREISDGNR
jgi:uncharacterized protein (TIRG00374 family)